MSFRKTIRIRAPAIPKDCDVLLTFNKLTGIGQAQQQIAWKVLSIPANAPNVNATAEYVNTLVFMAPQKSVGNIIYPADYHSVKVGGAVEFVKKGKNVIIQDTTNGAKDGYIVATNSTGVLQNMAIGLQPDTSKDPEPVLYFPDVGEQSQVIGLFHPALNVYVTSDYQQSQLIDGEVQSKVVKQLDLLSLPDISQWKLARDGTTGQYTLTQE